MDNIKLKFTGERVVLDDMHTCPRVLQEHIARYNFALRFVVNKTVLDAACGTGYGVDLISQLATQVSGCDIDEETIKFATNRYPNKFFIADLNNIKHDENYDIITSFETIEHLDKPWEFLKWVREHCNTLIFSIPINAPSAFHKQVWTSPQIVEMIEKHFPNTQFYSQQDMNFFDLDNNANAPASYIVGVGTK